MSSNKNGESSANKTNNQGDVDIEEEPEKVQESVNKLRDLIAEKKKLKVRMDDKFMLRYLRSNNYDPKQAYNKMKKVYKYKQKHREYFSSEPLSYYEDLFSKNIVTLLEDRNKDGSRIFLTKLGEMDIEHYKIVEHIKLSDPWLELALDEEETQKHGINIILDLGGMPTPLLKYLLTKHTITCLLKEEMRPWSKFEIHVVNSSKLVDKLVNFVYPVLGTKTKEHIHFHGEDWSSLHKFVDPDVLPPEYGGRKSVIDFPKLRQYLYDNEEKLMELYSLEYIKT